MNGDRRARYRAVVWRVGPGGGATTGEPEIAGVGFRRQQLAAFAWHAAVGEGQEVGVGESVADQLVDQDRAERLGRRERDWVGAVARLCADQRALVEGSVEESEGADTTPLWLVGAREVGAVPVQVKGADALTGRVLAADARKPAIVRSVAGGGIHRPEGVGRLQRSRVGADDDSVLEVAQRQARPHARLARFGDRPRTRPVPPTRCARLRPSHRTRSRAGCQARPFQKNRPVGTTALPSTLSRPSLGA